MDHKEFFNSLAEKWDLICKHDLEKLVQIIRTADIKKGDKVLDVGTGTGIMIPFLSESVKSSGEIIGLDISDKMLEVAKYKYPIDNVSFVEGDILVKDMQEDYFDVIMCYSVFPHFADQQLAITKMEKCLKRGGKIVIAHSQSREEINGMHKKASDAVSGDYLPDMETIKGYFLNTGMKIIAEVDNEQMFVVIGQR